MDVVAQVLSNREQTRALLVQILHLTRQQKTQLDADDLDGFAATSAAWNDAVSEIDHLQATFADMPADAKASLGTVGEQIQAVLQDIALAQQEVNSTAEGKLSQYKGQLRDVKLSNRRVSSYMNPYHSEQASVYFDKKQ